MCNSCPGTRKDALRTAMLMCLDCPDYQTRHDGKRPIAYCGKARADVVGLTAKGKTVLMMPCPRKRHPDALGRVRWLGMFWYGVPYPMRLRRSKRLARLFGVKPYTRPPAGCGCMAWAKTLWLKLTKTPKPKNPRPVPRGRIT
jgi:hypothetical protein